MYTTVYGWEELSDCSFGVISIELNDPKFNHEKEVISSSPDGHWYKTFTAAKSAQLKELNSRIKHLRDAKVFVAKQKLKHVNCG